MDRFTVSALLVFVLSLGFSSCQTPGGARLLSAGEGNKIDKIIKSMTLEEKIGQLFIVEVRTGVIGSYINGVALDYTTKQIYNNIKPGGYIFFAANCVSPYQTKALIEDLNSNSAIPPFIAVDEEGGIVARIGNNPAMGIRRLPSPQRIGNTGNPKNAYTSGLLIGEYLYKLGFNFNLAPVADVNTNPNNPVIGTRSFSSNPDVVAKMASAFNKGLRRQKIIGAYKHFPGHGDSFVDTHEAIDRRPYDMNRLLAVELKPFKRGIDTGADAILTAHIAYPIITGDTLPATLSSFFLTTLLRKRFKFKGLIITDSLKMGAITRNWSDHKAALMSFQAGADILLIPGNLWRIRAEFLRAVECGELSEERIDQSLYRILSVKYRYGIMEGKRENDTLYSVSQKERERFFSEVK